MYEIQNKSVLDGEAAVTSVAFVITEDKFVLVLVLILGLVLVLGLRKISLDNDDVLLTF